MPPAATLERSDRVPDTSEASEIKTWHRATVRDFFRQTNWENRPIEPPRPHRASPYEVSVRQFFQGMDWQWVPARSALADWPDPANAWAALGDTEPGPDGINAAAADEGLTLDGLTDLF